MLPHGMCEVCYVHKYRRLPDDQDPLEFHLQLLQPLIRTTTDSEQTSVGLNDTCVWDSMGKIDFTTKIITNVIIIGSRLFICVTGFLSLSLYTSSTQAFHSLFPIITYTQTLQFIVYTLRLRGSTTQNNMAYTRCK